MSWTQLVHESQKPPSLHSHTCVVDRDMNLLIFGGYRDEVGVTNEVWMYSTTLDRWRLMEYQSDKSSIPEPREMHASVYCQDNFNMYVMGGRTRTEDEMNVCQDLWGLNIRKFSSAAIIFDEILFDCNYFF